MWNRFLLFSFFFGSWILLCLCKLETLLIPRSLWVLLFFFSCFLLFSSILFFIFWTRSYVYASVLSLSPSLELYTISCMPVVFLFVPFCCCFILAFIPSLGAELILILLLHSRSLLSFHFLFRLVSFHYQTPSLPF